MRVFIGIIALQGILLWITTAANPTPGLKAQTPYSFDDIFNSSLRPRGFGATWIEGENAFYFRNSTTGDVVWKSAETLEERVLIPGARFQEFNTGTYFFSYDLRYVLFAYDIESVWRYSFNAKYKIWDRQTNFVVDFPNGALSGLSLQYAAWAPSSHALSFVHINDLYYQAGPGVPPRQITIGGDDTDIFYGIPDWLYEEDVLGDRVTHYWSPDSKYICYARIDSSQVPFISWPVYGSKDNVYGTTRQVRYPKPGDLRDGKAGPNPIAELFLVDTANIANIIKIQPPAIIQAQDHYFVQVVWVNPTRVYVTWTNRVQNYTHSTYHDVTAPGTPIDGFIYSEPGGWVEVPPPTPIFITDDTYITIQPRERGASGKWRQVALYTASTDIYTFISEDKDEEVDYLYGYDAANNVVYYSSTNGDPTERHIMKASTNDAFAPVCLTCGSPDSCRYITSSFSHSTQYYFLNCRGPEIPTYSLRSTIAGQENFNLVMEDNAVVSQNLAEKALPTRQFLKIPVGGGYMADAEIFYPPDHVEGTTYPLLVYAYAGPGSQRVMKTFPFGSSTANWLTYLKSTHKIIVVSVDSRGASGRGDKFKFEMYKNLGTVEIQDQIAAAAYFGDQEPLVNNNLPKGIFGWSYGGTAASHIIGDPTKIVTCGIAVAPVTSYMYYDTAYTERYLGLATREDGEAAYNRTDVMNKVENFRDKHFMLNHGTADDNVHYMQTTQFIQALANADIIFKQNAYIDQDHGIGGPARHHYHTMTDFLTTECWPTPVSADPQAASSAPSLRHQTYVTLFFITLLQFFLRI